MAESERLLRFVLEQSEKADQVVILGDLFHNHANIRAEVLEFWDHWLNSLSQLKPAFVLVGNHDMVGDYSSTVNALSVFSYGRVKNLNIISGPRLDGIFGYMPYIHDKKEFLIQANALAEIGAKVLICHGELNGAKYESGMEVKDGVDSIDIKIPLIISGHYHSRQRFGNIVYPGTARWLTSADKNEPKALWLVNHDDQTGAILQEEFLDTSHVCTPIYAYTYEEGSNCPEIPEGSRASVELIGTSEWVSKEKAKFKGRASISVKITDKEKPKNRKTGNSLENFVTNIFETTATVKKDKMINIMKELGIL
jgi:DNA repair exonuclease SbcCD nuclease subunit